MKWIKCSGKPFFVLYETEIYTKAIHLIAYTYSEDLADFWMKQPCDDNIQRGWQKLWEIS